MILIIKVDLDELTDEQTGGSLNLRVAGVVNSLSYDLLKANLNKDADGVVCQDDVIICSWSIEE